MENLKAQLFTDGGSRGNPGPAGIGWAIWIEDRRKIGGQHIGIATNNVAEYQALIRGLEECSKLGIQIVDCFLDSNLVVNQMKGLFKIKQVHLAILAQQAKDIALRFVSVSYTYIPREKNTLADKMANKALDKHLNN
ncbi:ribonuclease HI family protein [Candidatus Parcubacteria bacterium]|nr:ribonuclease HI family protein [Patescibacteria group bacterium]MCG2689074.1 ribonuclease HI family protein [Candidatus Parcubacteria bacterium]